jgi:hypothetical protein
VFEGFALGGTEEEGGGRPRKKGLAFRGTKRARSEAGRSTHFMIY